MRWLWHLYLFWVPERELLRESYRREEKEWKDLFNLPEEHWVYEKKPETPGPWWTRS
jgi:hypothetical protein